MKTTVFQKQDWFHALVSVLIVLILWCYGIITPVQASEVSTTSRYHLTSGPGVGSLVTRRCITEDDWDKVRVRYEGNGDGLTGVGDRVIISCARH